MGDTPKTQEQVASDLAKFLTTDRRGYGYDAGKSPLDEMLNAQITQMARQIAAQVIADTPALADHVKGVVERTVKRALANDQWLNQTVVGAVSRAITDLALERKEANDQ